MVWPLASSRRTLYSDVSGAGMAAPAVSSTTLSMLPAAAPLMLPLTRSSGLPGEWSLARLRCSPRWWVVMDLQPFKHGFIGVG